MLGTHDCCIYKHAKNNPKLVKSFLKAFSKGVDDFNSALVDKTTDKETSEKMVKLIHKYVYASKPYAKAAPSIRNGAMRINQNAKLNITSIKDQLDWFKKEKLVKKHITMDMLVDTSYVDTY